MAWDKGQRVRTSSEDRVSHVSYRIHHSASRRLLRDKVIQVDVRRTLRSMAYSQGMSRFLLTAEASSSPTRRGIDCSLLESPRRMPCSKFVCATASSARSSGSSSIFVKIAGTYPLSSWQRRCLRDKRAARNIRKQLYSTVIVTVRTCFSALQRGPKRRCYHLDLLLETNRLALPRRARVLRGGSLMLIVVTVDGKHCQTGRCPLTGT